MQDAGSARKVLTLILIAMQATRHIAMRPAAPCCHPLQQRIVARMEPFDRKCPPTCRSSSALEMVDRRFGTAPGAAGCRSGLPDGAPCSPLLCTGSRLPALPGKPSSNTPPSQGLACVIPSDQDPVPLAIPYQEYLGTNRTARAAPALAVNRRRPGRLACLCRPQATWHREIAESSYSGKKPRNKPAHLSGVIAAKRPAPLAAHRHRTVPLLLRRPGRRFITFKVSTSGVLPPLEPLCQALRLVKRRVPCDARLQLLWMRRTSL